MTAATGLADAEPPSPRIAAALAIAWTPQGGSIRLLATRRPPGKRFEGLWEWPGGKIEPGESPEDAACRELMEETGLRAERAAASMIGLHHDPGPPAIDFHLFAIRLEQATRPRLLACDAARWLAPDEAFALASPPANRAINRLIAAWIAEARSAPRAPRPSEAR